MTSQTSEIGYRVDVSMLSKEGLNALARKAGFESAESFVRANADPDGRLCNASFHLVTKDGFDRPLRSDDRRAPDSEDTEQPKKRKFTALNPKCPTCMTHHDPGDDETCGYFTFHSVGGQKDPGAEKTAEKKTVEKKKSSKVPERAPEPEPEPEAKPEREPSYARCEACETCHHPQDRMACTYYSYQVRQRRMRGWARIPEWRDHEPPAPPYPRKFYPEKAGEKWCGTE